MFWKRKKEPTIIVWATDRAREKGLLERAVTSVGQGTLTILVTHFEETRRRLREMLEQLKTEVCMIDSPSELSLSNLEAQRSGRRACLVPFSVLKRAGPFQQEQGSRGENVLILVPEVHPTNEPDEFIERWAESMPYSGPCELYCAFDGSFADSIEGMQRMRDMMARFGMDEDDAMEHKWLKRAIRKAQKRNATKAMSNQAAETQEDWFKLNF